MILLFNNAVGLPNRVLLASALGQSQPASKLSFRLALTARTMSGGLRHPSPLV